jgi:hypothetical protein
MQEEDKFAVCCHSTIPLCPGLEGPNTTLPGRNPEEEREKERRRERERKKEKERRRKRRNEKKRKKERKKMMGPC